MTKIDAIRKVMEANGGSATLSEIYKNAKQYKRDIEASESWKAGIRGVLYREVREGRNFRKIQDAKYGLI
ncbi:MAG: HTH domain-containing protein [Pseudomonadota bacterium]